ncbi:MAG: rhodanese-like domain-containing protein [Prevotellaceae bacterium]|jgi:rhodanese-related sulfurtransferase|nr:rhodanese-like domain-containing protein [Prevotellaceae bacterium]
MEKLDHLPKEISIVVVCDDGTRGTKVANMLNCQGYKDTANLDGGIKEWKANNLPIIETGFKPDNHSGCNGSCSGCC